MAESLMAAFFDQRLPSIRARLENWWNHGEQERPCLLYTAPPRDPAVAPHTDDLDRWFTDAEFVIRRAVKQVENQTYYGEAVPYHYVDLGSSAMAAALGARMQYVDKETIWPYPVCPSLESVLDARLDHGNRYYRRLREITRRSVACSGRHHFVSLFALGGIADTVGALYGNENLLVDMAMHPTRVEPVMRHVRDIWLEAFREFRGYLGDGNRGGIGWTGVWAPGITFPIQEDFSYMISNEMFRQFCLPHIADMVEVLDYPMYHLDGENAIRHLDSLLALSKLKAIQWTPGAGHESLLQWYPLIRRILSAGKSVYLYGRPGEVEDLISHVGPRGVLVCLCPTASDPVKPLLERYGVRE